MSNLNSNVQKPLAGFEHISRRWDKRHQQAVAKILPGEFYVTREDEMISTVLGSCVSACVRDSRTGIGGMNHFMLPDIAQNRLEDGNETVIGDANRYGNYAMEHLINTVLEHGGQRKNLQVKVFGGGKIISSMANIGLRNIRFVLDFIVLEDIELVAQDLGDVYPRKVLYFPRTGRARVKKLQQMHGETLVSRELKYREKIKDDQVEGDVELF